LYNSAIVLDRHLDGRVLDFGTTGKLRKSDLVMMAGRPKAGGSNSSEKALSAK